MATERGTTRGLLRPGEWWQTSRSAPAGEGRPPGLPPLSRPGEGGRPTGPAGPAEGREDLTSAELRDLLQELVGGPGGSRPVAAERLSPRVYRLHFRGG